MHWRRGKTPACAPSRGGCVRRSLPGKEGGDVCVGHWEEGVRACAGGWEILGQRGSGRGGRADKEGGRELGTEWEGYVGGERGVKGQGVVGAGWRGGGGTEREGGRAGGRQRREREEREGRGRIEWEEEREGDG